jgi:hypothetical protein
MADSAVQIFNEVSIYFSDVMAAITDNRIVYRNDVLTKRSN